MRPNHSRLMYALLCVAALAAPTVAVADPLSDWVRATPKRVLATCANAANANGLSQAPWFDFNGGTWFNCLMDGPYPFGGKHWYVLRMSGFVPANSSAAPVDIIRVCSLQAIHPPSQPAVIGPCGSASGVGPKGCEVCA